MYLAFDPKGHPKSGSKLAQGVASAPEGQDFISILISKLDESFWLFWVCFICDFVASSFLYFLNPFVPTEPLHFGRGKISMMVVVSVHPKRRCSLAFF